MRGMMFRFKKKTPELPKQTVASMMSEIAKESRDMFVLEIDLESFLNKIQDEANKGNNSTRLVYSYKPGQQEALMVSLKNLGFSTEFAGWNSISVYW
jgi:hypothetical protein